MHTFFAFAGLLGAAAAKSLVLDSLHSTPEGWHSVGLPEPDRQLELRIAMAQSNEALFEQTLLDISSPVSKRYGGHLKREELKELLKPMPEASAAVVEWLNSTGIQDINDDGEWIEFTATVEQAEELLDTQFAVYRNDRFDIDKVRTLQYSVPEQLHDLIDMIEPTIRFGEYQPLRSQVLDVERLGQPVNIHELAVEDAARVPVNYTACNATITPRCLKALYKIPFKGLDIEEGTDVGFAAFTNYLEQIPRFDDLAAFEAEYAPYAVGTEFDTVSVKNGSFDQESTDDSVEANLDAQYLLSIGYPVPITAYSTAGRGKLVPDLDQPTLADNANEPYLAWLRYMLALPNEELPHTVTTSYGENEQSVPLRYRKRVCKMFGELGARGVSVLFSSGDTGASSACQTNDGKNTTRFLPIFPAACPYVTSVGGTYHLKPERAIAFSSGGFSDTWERPAYQDAAVSEYLEILGDRWDGLYNPAGRGFPDIAAQSYRFHVVDDGEEILVGGTSASSPVIAGVVALLNAARLQAGLPTLGFLNPWLYSSGYKGLTDIVNGGSTGCTGTDPYSGLETPFVPYASWNATTGWDPVTGYGTPNFNKLLKLALAA